MFLQVHSHPFWFMQSWSDTLARGLTVWQQHSELVHKRRRFPQRQEREWKQPDVATNRMIESQFWIPLARYAPLLEHGKRRDGVQTARRLKQRTHRTACFCVKLQNSNKCKLSVSWMKYLLIKRLQLISFMLQRCSSRIKILPAVFRLVATAPHSLPSDLCISRDALSISSVPPRS